MHSVANDRSQSAVQGAGTQVNNFYGDRGSNRDVTVLLAAEREQFTLSPGRPVEIGVEVTNHLGRPMRLHLYAVNLPGGSAVGPPTVEIGPHRTVCACLTVWCTPTAPGPGERPVSVRAVDQTSDDHRTYWESRPISVRVPANPHLSVDPFETGRYPGLASHHLRSCVRNLGNVRLNGRVTTGPPPPGGRVRGVQPATFSLAPGQSLAVAIDVDVPTTARRRVHRFAATVDAERPDVRPVPLALTVEHPGWFAETFRSVFGTGGAIATAFAHDGALRTKLRHATDSMGGGGSVVRAAATGAAIAVFTAVVVAVGLNARTGDTASGARPSEPTTAIRVVAVAPGAPTTAAPRTTADTSYLVAMPCGSSSWIIGLEFDEGESSDSLIRDELDRERRRATELDVPVEDELKVTRASELCAGLAPFYPPKDDGRLLWLGPFGNRAEAQAMCSALEKPHKDDCVPVPTSAR